MYNLFPWIGKWPNDVKEFKKNIATNRQQNLKLFSRLKESLNPQMCRGFVDAFLVQKQKMEVRKRIITHQNYYLIIKEK